MSPAHLVNVSLSDWIDIKAEPLLIAGPCSAESEEQLLTTAREIAATGRATAIRAGVWKPRTRPGSFEGIGSPALKWMQKARQETGLPVITEVANASHVEECLKHGIDMLWIGARSTVNPFYVQEIADALSGVDIPVLIKNPIHPDVGLWLGALERLDKAGISKLAAVHRGFYSYESNPFRNEPKWELSFELKRLAPQLPILCDPSHIAGKPELILEVSQTAMDLNMDGLMIETHINPQQALSDAQQQITPQQLDELINKLVLREEAVNDSSFLVQLEDLRTEIDRVDEELIRTLAKRFHIVEDIGTFKKQNGITIFQMKRWFHILNSRKNFAQQEAMEESFIHELFQLIHKYSIRIQTQVMHKKTTYARKKMDT